MTTSPGEEAIRKTVHVFLSLNAAVAVWWLPHTAAASLLAAATMVALVIELARRASGRFARSFQRRLGPLLRDRESGRLTGATTLAIGYTTAALLFPGTPALAGILVAGLADAAAAVVGKRFGRVRYPGGKSLEGSMTFLAIVMAMAVLLLPGGHPLVILALALILTGLEALTLPVDDNLYLPPATAAAVHLALLLPGVTFFS